MKKINLIMFLIILNIFLIKPINAEDKSECKGKGLLKSIFTELSLPKDCNIDLKNNKVTSKLKKINETKTLKDLIKIKKVEE